MYYGGTNQETKEQRSRKIEKEEQEKWEKTTLHSKRVRKKKDLISSKKRSQPSKLLAFLSRQMHQIKQWGTNFQTSIWRCRTNFPCQGSNNSRTVWSIAWELWSLVFCLGVIFSIDASMGMASLIFGPITIRFRVHLSPIFLERMFVKLKFLRGWHFFLWIAVDGRILTLDNLTLRGRSLANRCCMCYCNEQSVDHLLLHCPIAHSLWVHML